ncbi:MAG TPA: ATP-dependent DNA ligase, partial [Candidatus Bathyarchaeia archaeon]|nr:ATP-dependent DNA ligase [Candidatus Bathyarchaeia archaeon]
MPTLFKSLAELLGKVEATKKRTETLSLVSDFLRTLEAEEMESAVSMILGRAFPKWSQKTLDLSWTTLNTVLRCITQVDWSVFTEAFSSTGDIGSATKELFEKTRVQRQTLLIQKQLTVSEVRETLDAIAAKSGSGSKQRKERLTEALFSQVTPAEAKYLVKILTGEMRTGFHEGLMEQSVAKAFDIPLATVQNASMALGDVGEAAALAKTGGKQALTILGFRVFRPVKPMLAQVADNVDEALKTHSGETAFEYKYDGARIQIHKLNDEVRIFSRRLTDATQSLPEIVESVKRNIKTNEAILEGEIIATDASGFPIPFQHLMRRFKRVHGIADISERIPLQLYLFDILHLNGESLIRLTYAQRRQILYETAGNIQLTKQIVTSNKATANKFLKEALNAGHEGLMAKKLDSPYTPGTRGKRWLKIKTVLEPLDLVISAAEYGYGRRHGWLSDYYLAARDAETGEFLELGKTFKGLTDAEIIEMTKRLKELAVSEDRWR